MDTTNFGSKFYLGRLVKRYPEFPLHYLQGKFICVHTGSVDQWVYFIDFFQVFGVARFVFYSGS